VAPILTSSISNLSSSSSSNSNSYLVGLLGSVLGYVVVYSVVVVEVEWLEGVKQEVAHILVHVRVHNASIKIVNHSTAVHYLAYQILQSCPRYHLNHRQSVVVVVIVVVLAVALAHTISSDQQDLNLDYMAASSMFKHMKAQSLTNDVGAFAKNI